MPIQTFNLHVHRLYSHSSTDRAVTRLRFGEICIETWDKAAMSPNITARYRATGVYHINHSAIPDATFAPSEDAQVCNVVTATETPAALLLLQQKIGKACPVPGTSGNVVSTNRNGDTLAYGTEEFH